MWVKFALSYWNLSGHYWFFGRLLDMERTPTGKNTDISKMTRGMKKLRLAYNHLSHKAAKVKCKHCSVLVRRDGLAAHRRSTKCARKNKKYDKKKHDSAKIKCGATRSSCEVK